MNELALFAGAGGGILGGHLLGWRTVCAVEIDPYCRAVLQQRHEDGILPSFPIWDDVRTFDGREWTGVVDVVSGGFPCQDISIAGKGAGITGARSGLWTEMARIIGEVRPQFAFVENVPALTGRGLDTVLGDLAALGYDAEWIVLGADDCGAPHKRKRLWIMAHSLKQPGDGRRNGTSRRIGESGEIIQDAGRGGREKTWMPEHQSGVGRVANGVAHRVDRLKAIGNGQVPIVAATAWNILMGRLADAPR
jgi:DNA (cytosine-5)-methyltransferase 1